MNMTVENKTEDPRIYRQLPGTLMKILMHRGRMVG